MIYLISVILIILTIITAIYTSYLIVIFIGGINTLSTSREATKKILEVIGENQSNKINFFDLGCGDGRIVLAVKKNFPNLNVFGVEKSCLIFFTKLKALLFLTILTNSKNNFFLERKNFFERDLREADIIYCYLPKDLLAKLEEKLKKELKVGTIIITNTTSFPDWQPKETFVVHPEKPNFEKLFLYRKE
jgi:trans-aconitate methyltransferase